MAIKIQIVDDTATGGSSAVGVDSESDSPLTTSVKDDKVSGKKSVTKSMMLGFFTSQAKSWAIAGTQAYTKYTGNSKLQQKIDMALNAVGNVTTIGAGFLAGGIPGGAIAIGTVTAQYGMSEFQNQMEIKTNNRSISIYNKGLGTRNINGGRYGA